MPPRLRGLTRELLRLIYRPLLRELGETRRELYASRFLLGQLHAARIRELEGLTSLRDAEFGVYSQFGEDGIIEYLVSRLAIPNETFVEFGVESYREANTRFLLEHRNWTGLVIDADRANIESIRREEIYWRHQLDAVCAFVTAENINDLIRGAGIAGDIGLLSIDVDGNDYWIWKAIEVVSPRIVVCEYNSVFGDRHAITVPYDPRFTRARAHYSHLYFGASLPALRGLAAEKGYRFVGCGSSGVNAFFVRADCAAPVAEAEAVADYVASRVRESRGREGELTFLGGERRAEILGDCTVYDLGARRERKLRELFPL